MIRTHLRWLLISGLCLVLVVGAVILVLYVVSRPNVPELVANVNDAAIGTHAATEVTIRTRYEDVVAVVEGRLVVPESRSGDSDNRVELFYRILPTAAAPPDPPVFFFAGGPGTSSTRIAESNYYYIFRQIQERSDVVLIDQRGTGGSNPNLQCYNQLDLPTDVTANVVEVAVDAVAAAVNACADKFRDAGVHLGSYNSRESAHDIEAIREALGYNTISIFGYSYGTTLAQHYISMFPDRVHRTVFAGPVGPDLALKLPRDYNHAFRIVDTLLAENPAARRYVPSLTEAMTTVHQRLEAEPATIRLPLMDAVSDDDGWFLTTLFRGISLFKPHWELTLTDQNLQMMLSARGGDPFWIRRLPAFYATMRDGDYREATNLLRNFRRETLPNLLFFTASCATGYSAERWAASAADVNHPFRHWGISFGRSPEVCAAVGVERQAGLDEPVHAKVPVLLLAGTLDTQAPQPNADILLDRFPNAELVLIENAAHTDLIDAMTGPMVVSFLRGDQSSPGDARADDHVTAATSGDARTLRVHRSIEFDSPVPYRYNLADTLISEMDRPSGGKESALDRYRWIREENADQSDYLWDLTEGALNALGYRLLQAGRVDDAIAIFELNVQTFPDAYNPHNSLAEAYQSAGRSDDARASLARALALNPYDGNSWLLLNRMRRETRETTR